MRRVLVAGKGSYIGYRLVTFCEENDLPCEVEELDVEGDAWKDADLSGFDSVVLVAGIAHRKETAENAHLYYEVNRDLAYGVARAAKSANVPHFVMLSTMSVYGLDEGVITPETAPDPKTHYGRSKLEGEALVRSLADGDFKVAILRPPMVYGPGCKGNFTTLRNLAERMPVFPLVDNERSVIYVDNLCAFILSCVSERREGTFFPQDEERMNTSEAVRAIAEALGERVVLSRAFGLGVTAVGPAVQKARKAFGSLTYEGTERHSFAYCVVPKDIALERSAESAFPGAQVRSLLSGSEPSEEPIADGTEGSPALLSITTAAFNSQDTIARTIESVLRQSYRPLEYIIMDGASSDGTVEIASSYLDKFRDAGIEYRVYSERDSGMYEAINKAMDRASGAVVGNVNSDDYYEPEALAKVMECYEETYFDAFQGNLLVHTAKGTIVKRARPMGWVESTRKWNHPTLFLAGKARDLRYRTDNPYADFDLFLRLTRGGCRVVYRDVPISNFSFGGMSTKRSIESVRQRIVWRNQIFRDNGCSVFTYAEGFLMELAKYVAARE